MESNSPCLVSGAGTTGRAERILKEKIETAHGSVLVIQPFWLWRPNDTSRMQDPDRQVALDMAKSLSLQISQKLNPRPQ